MTFKRELKGKALEKYKHSLKLTEEQRDVIIGTLLGDATMGLRSGKPLYSLKFEQTERLSPYIEHLFSIFKPFCGTGPEVRTKKTATRAVWFRTYRHDSFKYFFDIFYDIIKDDKGKLASKKRVPKNFHKLLNARVLAYCFMDDGTYHGPPTGRRQYYLSMQGFPREDCQAICQALKQVLDIQANVHRDGNKFRVYIKQESKQTFLSLIRPYIHPSFYYKVDESNHFNQ